MTKILLQTVKLKSFYYKYFIKLAKIDMNRGFQLRNINHKQSKLKFYT